MQVLIVDDNPIALLMLRTALESAGHSVSEASNGREALEVLARDGCRVVISDWQMPVMSGVELCRRIRSGSSEYVYFILLTGCDTPQERVAGLGAGADDFIAKPFDPAELVARIGTAERVLSLETREVAIFAMAKLAESRDADTGAHIERVQHYARLLAQELAGSDRLGGEIDPDFVRLIFATSPLHDIGKVAIPDSILLKPGRLSEREFEVMKTHTTIGAATLDAALERYPNAKFLRMARDIAACHHERFDGTGYPHGLAGDAIPLAARIVSVADVYDALVSRRVYKAAMGHEAARTIIIEGTGTEFDPEIVQAFCRCELEFQRIRRRYGDDEQLRGAA